MIIASFCGVSIKGSIYSTNSNLTKTGFFFFFFLVIILHDFGADRRLWETVAGKKGGEVELEVICIRVMFLNGQYSRKRKVGYIS